MPLAIVQAATAEAHRNGKLVFAHPSIVEGGEIVIRGHVDVLAHTVEDPEHWDNSLVARLKAANVSLIPTLTLFSGKMVPTPHTKEFCERSRVSPMPADRFCSAPT
jgi:hypothetical protein